MDSDKDAIRELLHQYCFFMDEGRFAELAELFTPDGQWVAPYKSVRGPNADRRMADPIGAFRCRGACITR